MLLAQVTREIQKRFALQGYFRKIVDGWQMDLLEYTESPARQYFLKWDNSRKVILRAVLKRSFGINEETEILNDAETLRELTVLIKQGRITATVFN